MTHLIGALLIGFGFACVCPIIEYKVEGEISEDGTLKWFFLGFWGTLLLLKILE